MVKAVATLPDGSTLIVMGISEANVQHLKDGRPIYFNPTALKIAPGTTVGAITLFYGRDETEMARMLKALIGPDTEVLIVPKGDERPH